MNIQLINIEKGKILIELFDSKSQKAFSTNIESDGGISSKSISIPNYCSAGIYNVRLSLVNGETFTMSVFIK